MPTTLGVGLWLAVGAALADPASAPNSGRLDLAGLDLDGLAVEAGRLDWELGVDAGGPVVRTTLRYTVPAEAAVRRIDTGAVAIEADVVVAGQIAAVIHFGPDALPVVAPTDRTAVSARHPVPWAALLPGTPPSEGVGLLSSDFALVSPRLVPVPSTVAVVAARPLPARLPSALTDAEQEQRLRGEAEAATREGLVQLAADGNPWAALAVAEATPERAPEVAAAYALLAHAGGLDVAADLARTRGDAARAEVRSRFRLEVPPLSTRWPDPADAATLEAAADALEARFTRLRARADKADAWLDVQEGPTALRRAEVQRFRAELAEAHVAALTLAPVPAGATGMTDAGWRTRWQARTLPELEAARDAWDAVAQSLSRMELPGPTPNGWTAADTWPALHRHALTRARDLGRHTIPRVAAAAGPFTR